MPSTNAMTSFYGLKGTSENSVDVQSLSAFTMMALLLSASCLFYANGVQNMWDPPQWVDFNNLNGSNPDRVPIKNVDQYGGDNAYRHHFDINNDKDDVAIIFLNLSNKDIVAIGDITPVLLNRDCELPSDNGHWLDVAGWVEAPWELACVMNKACMEQPYLYVSGNIPVLVSACLNTNAYFLEAP
jgi:hypothetical protein